MNRKFIKDFIPYSYWYTPEIEHDIHVDFNEIPDAVKAILEDCRGLIELKNSKMCPDYSEHTFLATRQINTCFRKKAGVFLTFYSFFYLAKRHRGKWGQPIIKAGV